MQSPTKPQRPSEVVFFDDGAFAERLHPLILMRRSKSAGTESLSIWSPRRAACYYSFKPAFVQQEEAPDPELASKLAALRWSKASARQQQEPTPVHGPCAMAEAAQQASADEPSKLQATVQSQLENQRQAAELEVDRLREQLKDAHAELAMERARAGQRAQEAEAALRQHIAALEEKNTQAKVAAHDELVACRDAGMKVSPFICILGMGHVRS